MTAATQRIIEFDLPERLACPQPTEDRNLARDEVRLLVTDGAGRVEHTQFTRFDEYLEAGDVLVVNTSATIPAALPVFLPDGAKGVVHFSNRVSETEWLMEVREITGDKTVRWKGGEPGMVFDLPDQAAIRLDRRFYKDRQLLDLWIAGFEAGQPAGAYLRAHARPIQYEKLNRRYPLAYYQTFFSFQPGSSEMPSAGRGFTRELVDRLLKKGVVFAPVLLHTGVSSLEENERPYPEYMEVDPVSAAIVNAAKAQARRVIAVGTTAIRALETATDQAGKVIPFRGDTELYIHEGYQMKTVDGLLTGFHEPRASHLHMLQSLAGFGHIDRAYRVAVRKDYYWHQFGDLHLILS